MDALIQDHAVKILQCYKCGRFISIGEIIYIAVEKAGGLSEMLKITDYICYNCGDKIKENK